MTAQARKVRFIRFESASHASRSSPSMSSTNSSSRSSRPARDQRRDVAEAPHRQRVVVGDEAERAGADAVEPARQQHAERLVGEPALERIGDEDSAGRRAGRSRPAPRRGRE